MRPLEDVDWSALGEGFLVMLTISEVSPGRKMQAADFKDMEALMFSRTRSWIGIHPERGARLGKGPVKMVDGVWHCHEDLEAQKGYEDAKAGPEDVSLEPIR